MKADMLRFAANMVPLLPGTHKVLLHSNNVQ